MDKEPKQTQGNKKMKQRVEDLRRNEIFLKKIQKLIKSTKSKKYPTDKEVDDLIKFTDEYRSRLKRYSEDKTKKIAYSIAEEYGLDNLLIGTIITTDFIKKDELLWGYDADMCAIADNYDEQFNENFPVTPIELDAEKNTHIRAYPISIDINKFATKRDIIDFVEKRWPIIESHLDTYRDGKKIRIRKRKMDRKLVDFIWDKKDKPIKQIKAELDCKFSNNKLAYYEIYKILSLEKSRRTKKLA